MPVLPSDLRKQLENVCVTARLLAESAGESALKKRGVDSAKPHPHFTASEKQLRNRLRARGRQAGDECNADGTQSIGQLAQELAYEYWHRMLFARFLAENGLLIDPDLDTSVDLEYCEEVAKARGAANGYVLAARFAGRMLPEIFRTDDVLLEIEFAPEQRTGLEKELKKLPKQTFLADDSLGWVYQFWQSKRKDEVNASGEKIGAKTVSAVTQLFTENYMVQFLLHNTIGAWWCAKQGVTGQGAGVRKDQSPVEMEYLRWRDDGTPAAGSFDGWPKTLNEFKLIDPCCGSGHFLVSAFNLLVPLRMHDEMLSVQEACAAVLRENLYGLELDPRCTQIAAFALALAAWKYPGADGHRQLPALNIAMSGQCVGGERADWQKLANGNRNLGITLGNLYELFQRAPDLGSLTDPRLVLGAEAITGSFAQIQPLLATAMTKYGGDAELNAVGVAAQGIAKAAELLNAKYTLVITNVPYLGRGKQDDVLKTHLKKHFALGKADLATAFVQRAFQLCHPGCTVALVTPQNWLFLTTYKKLREELLTRQSWNMVARLGPNAFQDMNFWASTTALEIISTELPADGWQMSGIDVSDVKERERKAARLANREPTPVQIVLQADQLKNPDSVINPGSALTGPLLRDYAVGLQGLSPADEPRYGRGFWEVRHIPKYWHKWRSTCVETSCYSGCEWMIVWDSGLQSAIDNGIAYVRGEAAIGKTGVVVNQMNTLPVSLHLGTFFDTNAAVIVPKDPEQLAAIWAFCSSGDFYPRIREIDQAVKVTNATLVKVPFDLAHWQAVAAEKYPNGLPAPHSDDPTQWLFKGDIATSTDPLQVAVARLLGYRWPEQPKDPDAIDAFADAGGIVCLPGVRGQSPGAERLLELLHAAYGNNWSDAILHQLLSDAGCVPGTTLEDWLRNQFFEQHCKRFHHRPFIWHIWDGRKDGFAALVNYHKLNNKTLDNLTYSYLGDWITAQKRSNSVGADVRLAAAESLQEKLKLILAGERPYDIFVRWKPLREQSIGWHPDLNDGVRMNIRPFVQADILRKKPNIKWTKDRGKEPERDKGEYPWFWNGDEPAGVRVNDVHLTIEVKQAARSQ